MGVPALGSLTNMKLALLVGTLLSLAAAAPDAEPTPDADADPWYTYGLRHYGYGHYRPYGYYGHRYGLWGKKKRDAEPTPDADADADADADPWYTYYGHGLRHYGYGHGYYGYRPYGHYRYGLWGKKKRDAEPTLMLMLMLMLTPGTVIMAMDSELMATMDLGIMVTTVPTTTGDK